MSTSTDVKETELNREELHDAHPDIMESIQVACKQQSLNALEHIETAVTHRLTKLKSTGPAAMLIMVLLYVIRMMTFSIARREDEASRLLDDKAALLRDVTTLEKQVADLKRELAESRDDFAKFQTQRSERDRLIVKTALNFFLGLFVQNTFFNLYPDRKSPPIVSISDPSDQDFNGRFFTPVMDVVNAATSTQPSVAAEATSPQDEDVDYFGITPEESASLDAIVNSQGASTDDGLNNLFEDAGDFPDDNSDTNAEGVHQDGESESGQWGYLMLEISPNEDYSDADDGTDFPNDNPGPDDEGFYAGESLSGLINLELSPEAYEYHQNGDSDPSKTVTTENRAINLEAHKAETVETAAVSAQEFIDAMPAEPPSS